MHEFGIAQSIVDSALAEADKAGAKVTYIEIEVGELMQLDVETLEDALTLLMKGPRLEGAEAKVRVTSAAFSCRRCGREWEMDETKRQLAAVPDDLKVREPDSLELPLHFLPYLYPAFVRCPDCGSSDTAVTAGEDIVVRRVTLDG
jgi:hydrogenase nickel incorporation protein HypA/HybF